MSLRDDAVTSVVHDARGMHAPLPERTGVLVIRVWVEDDPAGRLRARITQTVDVENGEEVTATASTREEIEAVVHAWLDRFVRTSGAALDPPVGSSLTTIVQRPKEAIPSESDGV